MKTLTSKIVNNTIFGFGKIVRHNTKTGLVRVMWDNVKYNCLAFQLTFVECVTVHNSYTEVANKIVTKLVNAGLPVETAIQTFRNMGSMFRPKAIRKTETNTLCRIRKTLTA